MLDLFWLAVVTLTLWLAIGAWWARGIARLERLGGAEWPAPERWPPVAVVVPARNEAEDVDAAMRTLLALDYPDLEIVMVDDRSDDGTGAILDRWAERDPRVRVIHVESLPAGWLGKTHAMQRGAEATSAPWLMFTDADVHFRRDALREAVAFAIARERDHLAGLPSFVAAGPFVGAFMGAFALLFGIYTRLWAAPDPASDAAIGIGAFGLVRRTSYVRAGEHVAVRMRPDDDLALGRALKAAGGSQEAVLAGACVAVAWYPDLLTAIRGMRKNAFAGFGFSVPLALAVVIALLVTHVFPYIAVFATGGTTRAVYAGVLLTIAFVYAWNQRVTGHPAAYALVHPVAVLGLSWAVIASIVHAFRSGGVEWRGTHYPLDEMRRKRGNGPPG